jgi:hypothetical protein
MLLGSEACGPRQQTCWGVGRACIMQQLPELQTSVRLEYMHARLNSLALKLCMVKCFVFLICTDHWRRCFANPCAGVPYPLLLLLAPPRVICPPHELSCAS